MYMYLNIKMKMLFPLVIPVFNQRLYSTLQMVVTISKSVNLQKLRDNLVGLVQFQVVGGWNSVSCPSILFL